MIGYFLGKQIDKAEKSLGGSLHYLRHVLRVSLPDFFRLRRLSLLLNQRLILPPAPFHVARLVAVMSEDCGECVQMEIHLARQAGVPADVVQAVISLRPSDLPEELGDVYLFAECVVQNAGDVEPLRTKMRHRYGEKGLIELSLAIALARTFPTVKRGLGYASTCNLKGMKVA
jgi:alkylhydroperoxidase family enzyme